MNELITEDEINIEDMIYEIRGKQVMFDNDLAKLYQIETGALNRQMKRNNNRFPSDFCFQLSKDEYKNLKCQIGISKSNNTYGGRRTIPYVYTEYGVSMLSSVLHTDVAINMSIKIIRAFIQMKRYISNNLVKQRYMYNQVMRNIEDIAQNKKNIKLLQESFDKLEEKKLVNEIYFNGQIYDAYSKIVDILSISQKELIIIDGYADRTTLDIIKNIKCNVILIIKNKSKITSLDIEKYNKQYHNLKIIYNNNYHDRYFIIDRNIVYHCGTSINYAGSKTFSINKIEDVFVKDSLINNISKVIE